MLKNGFSILDNGNIENIQSGTVRIDTPFPCVVLVNGVKYAADTYVAYVARAEIYFAEKPAREAKREAERKAKEEAERKAREIRENFTIENGVLVEYKGKDWAVVIPEGVTSIGEYAFRYCTGLTTVIYNSNQNIPTDMFYNCTSVAKYDFRNANAVLTLEKTTHLGHATGCKIVVPDTLYDSWKAATNWSALTDVVWVKASEYTEG